MGDERLARIENQLQKLIRLTEQNHKIWADLGQRLDKLEHRLDALEQKGDFESTLHTKRHLEILQQFRSVKADSQTG
mgnify:CR=1 FL=1